MAGPSGRVSGLASQQDGGQFEDALRRLHALEKKLTDQVHVDITELRNKWVQPRVDRVSNNTFKLWQVRENLKKSKVLYVEEERLLDEFKKVKDALITASMDDEYFEATKDTCVFLGGKLTEVRNQQLLCYSGSRDLETEINKDIMTIRFEDKDFADLDIEQVRASTPLREREPTPLDRHRSMSREPSPSTFKMPPMRLSCGTTTPGGSSSDPHAYFSRPGSSQSVYGGRGGFVEEKKMEDFRSKLEALHADDDSPPQGRRPGVPAAFPLLRDASGHVIKDDPADNLTLERPGSAMSDMSIQIGEKETSRPGSRMSQDPRMLGDELSHSLLDLSMVNNALSKSPQPSSGKSPQPPYGLSSGKNMLDDLDVEINLGEDAATKRDEENEAARRSKAADTKRQFEEMEKERKAAETAQKKAEAEAKAEKMRLEKEAEAKKKEENKKADEKKLADMAEKKKVAAEKKAEEEAKKKEEESKKKEAEKLKKLEEKAKKEAEEKKKEADKQAKEDEKKAKLEEKKRKMEEAKEKKQLEEAKEKKQLEEATEKKQLEEEQKN